MLRRFASCFPGTNLVELGKTHLDKFFSELDKLPTKSRNKKHAASAKVRNHHRAAIRQFLAWAVRKDYLSATHRLGEADGLRPERANTSETEFYTPVEFKALLEAAQGPLLALVALAGFAGLRSAELLRLSWEDTHRVPGHIEISSGKSKTRQRRLVEIVPALAQWLEPFKELTGKIWTGHEVTFQQHLCDLCDNAKYETKPGHKATVKRKHNGLRHAFCTYHFAAHGNENLTAQQAGNSPAMVHSNYKGLTTKREGEAWFAVTPVKPANVISLTATSEK
jgi:integrase